MSGAAVVPSWPVAEVSRYWIPERNVEALARRAAKLARRAAKLARKETRAARKLSKETVAA